MMFIIQIGEAVSRITESEVLSTIPVKEIIGFRNRIVHGNEEMITNNS